MESLCCTSETNITLYVSYMSIKKRRKEGERVEEQGGAVG